MTDSKIADDSLRMVNLSSDRLYIVFYWYGRERQEAAFDWHAR